MTRRRTWALCALLLHTGCAYVQNSIRDDTDDPKAQPYPPSYPRTVEDELKRQQDRTSWSTLAGPFEMLGGGAIIFVGVKTIGAPANPNSGGSTSTKVVNDAAAQTILSALLIGIGGALLVGGFGDLFAGLVGRALDSPFIVEDEHGEQRLLPPTELDKSTFYVSPSVQFDTGLELSLSERGSEMRIESGAFQWLSRSVRLRYGLEATFGSPFFSQDRFTPYAGVGPALFLDWNVIDRSQLGRYPRGALTLYASPGYYTAFSSFDPRFGYRAGTGLTFKSGAILFGISHFPSIDPRPQFEVSIVQHFVTN